VRSAAQVRERCSKRDKALPTPPSFPLDRAAVHPTYRHRLEPGAQCELAAGHDGPHRNGCLIWHDPPRIMVGGKPYEPPAGEWQLPSLRGSA